MLLNMRLQYVMPIRKTKCTLHFTTIFVSEIAHRKRFVSGFGCFKVEKFLALIFGIPGYLVYRDHASPSLSLLHATRRDILMATILGETLVYSSVT